MAPFCWDYTSDAVGTKLLKPDHNLVQPPLDELFSAKAKLCVAVF